ncbi:MAG: hypothetical protein ACYDH8_16480 [Syntrophales bacterium]
MGFADQIKQFVSNTKTNLNQLQKGMPLDEFLAEHLGVDAKLITSIKFDPEKQKFYDVEAPESVIAKLREAGYLRE